MNSGPVTSISLILLVTISFINYAATQDSDSGSRNGADSSKPPAGTGTGMIWKKCQREAIVNTDLTEAREFCLANTPQPQPKNNKGQGNGNGGQRRNRGMANNWCFRACLLKRLGWVYDAYDAGAAADGEDADAEARQTFNRTKALSSVQEIFPSDIQVRVQYGILKCAKSDAAEGLSMNKLRCNSYAKLVRCIDRVVRVNCRRPKRTTTEAPSTDASGSDSGSDSTPASDTAGGEDGEDEMPSPASTTAAAFDDSDSDGADANATDGSDAETTETSTTDGADNQDGNDNGSATEESDTDSA